MSYIFKLSDDTAPSLREVFEERGWIEWDVLKNKPDEWNILWSTKRFFMQDLYSLNPYQKLNHFRRTSQITRKDSLNRNLKRMKCNFNSLYRFYPLSYQFPLQYSDFIFKYNTKQKSPLRSTNSRKRLSLASRIRSNTNYNHSNSIPIWIAKPASGRRGQNIKLFRDVSFLQKNKYSFKQPMIVQKYIHNPLLIGGYKFDLRIYVLVTSFRPLNVYCYNEGLCRFGTNKYDLSNLNNVYSHLTNSSINKKSNTFKKDKDIIGKGCKWTLNKLFNYLQKQFVNKQCNIKQLLWKQIYHIIILTLLPIIMDVQQSNNCFELFGFDILIDKKYNCWLLEVNGSPAIAVHSDTDKKVKYPMLNDLINVVSKQTFIQSTMPQLHDNDDINDIDDITDKLRTMNVEKEMKEESINPVDYEQSNDENVGGFKMIFPFNPSTFEANKVLTNLQVSPITRSQVFTRSVTKEIKKRRQRIKI